MHDDEPTPPDDAEFGFMDDFGFADGADDSPRDAHAWRMPALAAGTCLAAVAVAILLLQFTGGGSNKNVSEPIVTGGPTSPALISSPAAPASTTVSRPAHPIHRVHTSATPTRTHTATASATPTPTLTSSAPHTSHVPSTTTAPPPSTSTAPTPGVFLAKGGRDFRCGQQCYFLIVTLRSFTGGHRVVCEAQARHSQVPHEIGNYDTTSPISSGCSYSGQHDSVWVVVDDTYRSNTVTNW